MYRGLKDAVFREVKREPFAQALEMELAVIRTVNYRHLRGSGFSDGKASYFAVTSLM